MISPDGTTYVYSFRRVLGDLFLATGMRTALARLRCGRSTRLAGCALDRDLLLARHRPRASRDGTARARGEVDRLRVQRVLAQARLGELDRVLVAGRERAVDEIVAVALRRR